MHIPDAFRLHIIVKLSCIDGKGDPSIFVACDRGLHRVVYVYLVKTVFIYSNNYADQNAATWTQLCL